MIINVAQVLKKDGEDLQENGKVVELRHVLKKLLHEFEVKDPTPEKVVRYYNIGEECMTKDEVELTSEDITYIKSKIVSAYLPFVSGQVCKLLEGETI